MPEALVQIVDILRDQCGTFACAIKARERPMAAAGPGLGEILLHGKAPPPGFVTHVLAGHKGVERYRLVLGPQSPGRTKIGDPAFGRDSGPGKRDDHRCVLEQVTQARNAVWKISGNHFCIVGLVRWTVMRFSLCDICTPCCAFVISMRRSISIVTSSA